MKIRMYDCGFGDCFQIDEGDNRLIVDGGWESRNLSAIISELKSDAQQVKQWSFVLTHYHDDHFRGFFEMIAQIPEENRLKFDQIYIPDVWNADTDVELVALLLMSELKKGKLYLIDFLIGLMKTNATYHFVKAGDIIEDRYKVLWPKKEVVSTNAKKDFDLLWSEKTNVQDKLAIHNLAEKLIENIAEWKKQGPNGSLEENTLDTLNQLRKTQQSFLNDETKLGAKNKRIGLADYGNNVSIVFQSHKLKIPRILFTGDFPLKYWVEIYNELSDKFDVVKVPHHGTKNYYWNKLNEFFSDTATILIPNGDAGGHEWYIDHRYPEYLKLREKTIASKETKIYCFHMNACPVALGNGHECVCSPNGGCIPALTEYLEVIIP